MEAFEDDSTQTWIIFEVKCLHNFVGSREEIEPGFICTSFNWENFTECTFLKHLGFSASQGDHDKQAEAKEITGTTSVE